MSGVQHVGLEDSLAHQDPIVRLVARGTASTWTEQFQKWVNDEVNGRGSSPNDVMLAVIDIQIMLHSSLITNFVEPQNYEALADLYKGRIESRYVGHAIECQVHKMGGRQ